MNKLLITLILILAGIGVAGFLVYEIYILRTPNVTVTDLPSSGTPNTAGNSSVIIERPETKPVQDSNSISIRDTSGGSLVIKNIKNDPALVKDTINPGYYYLGYHHTIGTTSSDQTPPYIIEYIESTGYFNIAILQEPLGVVREEMEKYLALHLGISQTQLCILPYMVSVPYSVNKEYAGRNLGFSFCPGAEAL